LEASGLGVRVGGLRSRGFGLSEASGSWVVHRWSVVSCGPSCLRLPAFGATPRHGLWPRWRAYHHTSAVTASWFVRGRATACRNFPRCASTSVCSGLGVLFCLGNVGALTCASRSAVRLSAEDSSRALDARYMHLAANAVVLRHHFSSLSCDGASARRRALRVSVGRNALRSLAAEVGVCAPSGKRRGAATPFAVGERASRLAIGRSIRLPRCRIHGGSPNVCRWGLPRLRSGRGLFARAAQCAPLEQRVV
jgi:hypothetical protein